MLVTLILLVILHENLPYLHLFQLFGTNAATESTTINLIAPLLTNASTISNACSPVSGCATNKLSISTPKFFWHIQGLMHVLHL